MDEIKFNNIFNSINYHNLYRLDYNNVKKYFANNLIDNKYIFNYKTPYWIYFLNTDNKDFNSDYCLFGKFMIYNYNPDKNYFINFYHELICKNLSPMIKFTNPNLNKKSKTVCIYTNSNSDDINELAGFLLSNKILKDYYYDIPFRCNWEIKNCVSKNNNKNFILKREMMLSDFREL